MSGLRGAPSRIRAALILLVFFLCLFGTVRWWGRLFFPLSYWPLIEAESGRHRLDPLLILAIIREESAFDPKAISSRGARGLMQVMPETGAWIAARLGEEFMLGRLFVPADNIRFGTWYLAALLAEFQGDLTRSLVAYNAGGNKVRAWLAEGTWDGSLAALDRLPYKETRRYVIKIIRSYRIYRFLYQEP